MCFTHDHDWCAESHRETEGESDEPAKCIECGSGIAAGEWRRRVEQREYDECQICEEELSERWTDTNGPCPPGRHDYGETFEADWCRACCRILESVEAVERDAGCPDGSRLPAYGELRQAIYDDSLDGEARYARRVVEMFPELADVGFIRAAIERAKGGA